jgi:hypothetical protein
MATEEFVALDTNVVVAAIIGPGDRLAKAWSVFDGSNRAPRFIPARVMQEYYEVVEGVGRSIPGVRDQLVSDALQAIRLGQKAQPGAQELAAAGITGNRIEKVNLLLGDFQTRIGAWDPRQAREMLYEFEREYADRKKRFLDRHAVMDPPEGLPTVALREELAKIIPGGGKSWVRDCEIIGEIHEILVARSLSGILVTEDAKHIGRHSGKICGLTAIKGIQDLGGKPY